MNRDSPEQDPSMGEGDAQEPGPDTVDGSGLAPPPDRVHSWLVLSTFLPLAVVVDQVTKQLAESRLAHQLNVRVIDGFFMLRYSRNRGAFFSLGENLPDGVRRAFFVTATLGALALIVHLYRRATAAHRALRWGLLFLAAGALGNLIDRVLYGEVIDFLHLHYQDVFHWATFNVADIYICIGLALLVVDMLRPRPESATEPQGVT